MNGGRAQQSRGSERLQKAKESQAESSREVTFGQRDKSKGMGICLENCMAFCASSRIQYAWGRMVSEELGEFSVFGKCFR